MEFRRINDPVVIAALNEPAQNLHYQLYPEFFQPYDKTSVEAFFTDIIDNESYIFQVCYIENAPAGFVWFEKINLPENAFLKRRDKVYVHQMSVNEEFRGKGIGSALLNEVFSYAREHSVSRVELDYWIKNVVARGFYEKLGFVVRKETAYIDLD